LWHEKYDAGGQKRRRCALHCGCDRLHGGFGTRTVAGEAGNGGANCRRLAPTTRTTIFARELRYVVA
jgi:hypothetical protein